MLRAVAVAALFFGTSVVTNAQPAANLTAEVLLSDRLGLSSAEMGRFAAGEVISRSVPETAANEIAAVGALRSAGNLKRLIAWMRDIESFMRAAGTQNVGAIKMPATAADFARLNLDDVEFADLASCRPGRCAVRMPAAYLQRFQKEVNFKASDARAQAAALTRTLVAEYVDAYQKGGDAAVGALHDPSAPDQPASQFRDMLRRSTKVWDLAFPFVSYLETYPAKAPARIESRFYWTRDAAIRKPTLTLHHVVLEELQEGRMLLGDKQFYASRDLDTALMIALAIPAADYKNFDLIVSVKARAGAISGVTGRVLRGRIEQEMTEGLRTYLTWIRDSMKL